MRREPVFGAIAFLAFCALLSSPAPAFDRIRIGLSSSSLYEK